MAKLAKNVWIRGLGWFGPAYPGAGDPPAGAVTNPQCWDGDPPKPASGEAAQSKPEPSLNPAPAVAASPPPRSGRGATDEAWTVYARNQGVAVTDSMSRREVIEACEKAGVPT